MSELKIGISQNDHILGDDSAPVSLVEYGDYECPHCGAAHPIVKALLSQFGNQLRFVYRHFPLTQIHPHAEAAAETAEFAGAHERFWQMHDLIFDNQDRLGVPLLFEAAASLGLSADGLRDALANGEYRSKVRSDFAGGVRSGVNGTPTFFVNGYRHNGSYAFDDLADAIEARLTRAA